MPADFTNTSFSALQTVGFIALTFIVTAFFLRIILFRRWNRLFRRRSQSVVKGLVNEQFAPILKGFPGAPCDARFLGKPIDYIVFKGLSDGEVNEIVFVEVKSHSRIPLTRAERSVRDAVTNRRVSWAEFYTD